MCVVRLHRSRCARQHPSASHHGSLSLLIWTPLPFFFHHRTAVAITAGKDVGSHQRTAVTPCSSRNRLHQLGIRLRSADTPSVVPNPDHRPERGQCGTPTFLHASSQRVPRQLARDPSSPSGGQCLTIRRERESTLALIPREAPDRTIGHWRRAPSTAKHHHTGA